MTPSEVRRQRACKLSLQRLTWDLSNTGFISSCSVVRRFMPYGKLGCRCQANPPQLRPANLLIGIGGGYMGSRR